jgi:hypothetical protein
MCNGLVTKFHIIGIRSPNKCGKLRRFKKCCMIPAVTVCPELLEEVVVVGLGIGLVELSSRYLNYLQASTMYK